jgi:4a-hydroxytetrahydrobiopterin dehydratase
MPRFSSPRACVTALLAAAFLGVCSAAPFYRIGGESCDLLDNNTAFFSSIMPCADFASENIDERCLAPGEIAEAMRRIPSWTLSADNKVVRREYKFLNFREAFTFLTRAAQLQDKNDHHALITSVYNSAAFEYTSDQLGCLGTFDIESAAACDALLTLPQAD